MLKVGLIGCGFMGNMHAECYKNIKGAKLSAVADIRREKAEEAARGTGAEIYEEGMRLIEEAQLDVIDICLPTYMHAEYAAAAMKKVKYVFIEKPATLTVEEGKSLLDLKEKTGAEVQVGQVIRFWDEYVELKKYICQGIYGKVVNANFRRISPRPDWGYNGWLTDSSLSGGAGQDLHIHDIDFVLSVFGMPETSYTVKNKSGEENSYINTLMAYPDFVVSVEGTWDLPASHPFEATFRVRFEKATIEYAGGKFMLYDDNGAREIKIEKTEIKGDGEKGGNISNLGGYYNELVYFCDCAEKGAVPERALLIDALKSVEFVREEAKREINKWIK